MTKYLGRGASKWVSYPASAIGGFVLAVCSCTIMPSVRQHLQEGCRAWSGDHLPLRRPRRSIFWRFPSPAYRLVWTLPWRVLFLSLIFGVTIGLLMAWIFRKDDAEHDAETNNSKAFAQEAKVPGRVWAIFGLLAGCIDRRNAADWLADQELCQLYLSPIAWAPGFQAWLDRLVPPNPALGDRRGQRPWRTA